MRGAGGWLLAQESTDRTHQLFLLTDFRLLTLTLKAYCASLAMGAMSGAAILHGGWNGHSPDRGGGGA